MRGQAGLSQQEVAGAHPLGGRGYGGSEQRGHETGTRPSARGVDGGDDRSPGSTLDRRTAAGLREAWMAYLAQNRPASDA